jgi:acetylornithine deacetylase/succinyl-diaminopimelate desuccinylase-like protein
MNINWEIAVESAISNLSSLIQLDTANPPGNELPAVQLIRDILLENGIPEDAIDLIDCGSNRGNLIARLRGDGSARPLMLTGHVDVVPVERECWSRDPFGGEIAEGCVWGRGALDMKGIVASYLQAFILAHQQKLPLKRDLIFAAIADEEMTFEYGSRYLVNNHPDLIDAEYALCEDGGKTMHLFGLRIYQIKVAEKGVCWLNAKMSGTPGHASIPHEDNALFHLVEALDKLRVKKYLPFHITPLAKRTLDTLARNSSFPKNLLYSMLRYPLFARIALERLPAKDKQEILPMISNTFSPTVLKAGSKTNVIPSQAEAHIDCRTLPGFTPQDAMREIRDITGSGLTLETLDTSVGPQVPIDSTLYQVMEKSLRKMDPEGVIIPYMSPGASDAVEYSKAGIKVYGFSPGILPAGFPFVDLIHGHDERIPIETIKTGLPVLWEVVSEFCCSQE